MRKRLLAIILVVFILISTMYAGIMAIADGIVSPTGMPTAEPTAVAKIDTEEYKPDEDNPDANKPEETGIVAPEDDSATAAPTASPAADPTATPTAEITTQPSDESISNPTFTPSPLQAALTCNQRYAHADRISIDLALTVAGGVADYEVTWEVSSGDEVVSTEAIVLTGEGEFAYSYMPSAGGDHTVKASIVDGTGQTAEAFLVLPVSADDNEGFRHWENKLNDIELTGDWREDLLAVAGTQIGYRESRIDFCIDKDGNVQGATLYGQWYRSPYAEWCGMFISWCLYNAGIDETDFPYEANCQKWVRALEKLDAYEAADGDFEPLPGDLVFFAYEDDDKPRHVGIVESVGEDRLYTIEGNSYKHVEQKEYDLDDPCIIGYANMETLMLRAGILPTAEPTEEPTPVPDTEATEEPTPVPDTEATAEPDAGQADDIIENTAESAADSEEIIVTEEVRAVAALNNTDSRLLVHEEASLESKRVQSLRHNEAVTVLAVKGDWLKVVTKENVTGYVAASYMKVTEGELPLQDTESAPADEDAAFAPDGADVVYYCGLEEHIHTDECGEDCEATEHVHDESCKAAPVYYCGLEEHAHSESCGDDCMLAEHTHTEECKIEPVYYCGQDEHIHGDDCFDENGELVCALAEHQHTEECEIAPVYYCGLDEHIHGDDCFDADGGIVCGLDEHVHDESCLVRSFNIDLNAEDVRLQPGEAFCPVTVSARLTGAVLPCEVTFAVELVREANVESAVAAEPEQEENAESAVAADDVAAYSDEAPDENAKADANAVDVGGSYTATVESENASITFMPAAYGVYRITATASDGADTHAEATVSVAVCLNETESAADWEASLAGADLTDDLRLNVAAVAQTQLGYTESTVNFALDAAGEVQGYTRYGEWYGSPYAEWCAMFASFCLSYAGVDDVPFNANCEAWVDQLMGAGLYRAADTYFPLTGDLIFFDWDGDGKADHVGIVEENAYDLNAVEFTVTAIEGNVDGAVVRRVYSMPENADILGYGQIGENELQDSVDAVVAAIDALPDPDEAIEYLNGLEDAEDYDAVEAYYKQYGSMTYDAYIDYQLLDVCLRGFVYNYEKLSNLEWLWSFALMLNEIASDAPTTVASASTREFVDMNLYDYGGNINYMYNRSHEYPGFQWNGGAYKTSTYDRHRIDNIDFGNSMITDYEYTVPSGGNNGKSASAVIVGNQGGAINGLDISGYGTTNRPIGMSLNSSINDRSADVLMRTLGSDGYPALKNGNSLAYLFKNGTYANKKNTVSIDGLFVYDPITGEYSYNSRKNHAQYSNNRFTLYNQIITPNFITYPFGNFLPLNDITDPSKATQVGKITSIGTYVQEIINDLWYDEEGYTNVTRHQLVDMLAKYRDDLEKESGTAWTTWTAKNAIVDYFTTSGGDNPSDDTGPITDALLNKMYNIDWDVRTNFFFGLDMSMKFMQPRGGMTGQDTNRDGESDYPMKFYFTGDDDVWVYIDGVLFLDLSGIHRHVGGEIDFVNGKVYYYYLDTANTGDVSSTPYKTYTFREILSAAGKDTSGLNEKGTFKDYTVHDFKFFYMERGSGSSVCRINFNFPMLKQNSISVSKELTSDSATIGNPDFKFQVLKAQGTAYTEELFIGANREYSIYDRDNNLIGTGTTDANGVFTLKAGQRAEFDGIAENSGKYYVRELLEGTVFDQYDQITVSGSATTTSGNVQVGNTTFTGVRSPIQDASDGTTVFRFDNAVDEEKLGTLTFGKTVARYPDGATVTGSGEFTFSVTLDGEPLPVNSKYTVGNIEKTVETSGEIKLSAGQTAVISGILAGTSYTIEETGYANYNPSWTVINSADGTETTVEGSTVTGQIATGVNARYSCTNSELGTSVTIPVVKNIANPDGLEHTFSFTITELNADGTAKGQPTEKAITLSTASHEAGLFELYYPATSLNAGENVFRYRITENAVEGAACDDSVYVVTVTVNKQEDGTCSAVISITRNDTSTDKVEFTNTLLSDISISKTVSGGGTMASETDFSFTVTLKSGENAVSGTFTALLRQENTAISDQNIEFDSTGKATFTLSHGQTLTIKGVPVGTVWNVTETDYNGFLPYIGENQTDTSGDRTVNASGNGVVFVNKTTFRFPGTGGPGRLMYIVTGALLLSAAGLSLYMKRRNRSGKNT